MTVHIVKLCVGCDTPEDLQDWIHMRLDQKRLAGEPVEYFHTTRMMPKRIPEVLDGGSIYWVMKGNIQCRQAILDIRSFTNAEGVGRCRLVLDPTVVRTEWQPRRPFQGWRYYPGEDAPADLGMGHDSADIPDSLRQELIQLGLM